MSKSYDLIGAFIISLMFLIPTARAETPLPFGWSAVAPHTADYDGDRHSEQGLFDSTKGTVYARKLNGEELAFDLSIALPGFIAACADFDGDGKADPGSYDLTNGVVYAFLSEYNYQLGELPCAVGDATTTAKPADYDGDRKADPALYDSASGVWLIYPSASGYQPVSFILGGNSAVAVPADYDGDRKADPCVYDQTNGLWMALCSASQYAPTWVVYGGPGCEAAPADFDGDHKADPTVYCSALGVWGTLNSASNFAPNIIIQGGPDCTPIPGNYYFTNRADYALYNTANNCWYIDYQSPMGMGILAKLGCKFLKYLVKGSISGSVSGTVGWSLRRTFDVNNDPSQWGEMVTMITNMNRKLDELLDGQIAIQDQITALSAQLQYNMDRTIQLMDGGPAKEACSMIRTHYDQIGPDSYRSFYECDTNNLPPNSSILSFAANVKGAWDIANQVTRINDAIMPSAISPGLLWDWAALATNRLTMDNLTDHFTALVDYYGNLYAYQMKGVTMYADACRVADTSAWASAQVANYITNTVANMIQQQTDLFRDVTRAYLMTVINAQYNPFATSLTNTTTLEQTLAMQEFYCRQWLGQTQNLCATFLTTDRPEQIAKYMGVTAARAGQIYQPQPIVTNWVAGHAYGYQNPDLRTIVVSNGYVFIRYYFGELPPGNYALSNTLYNFGTVAVSNYDEDMNPTSDQSDTNWFGHLFASPSFCARLDLPKDDATQWTRWTLDYVHSNTDFLQYTDIEDYWPSGPANFTLGMRLHYQWKYGKKLPSWFGGYNWTYAAYRTSIVNALPRPVKIRLNFFLPWSKLIYNYDSGYCMNLKYRIGLQYDSCGTAILNQSNLQSEVKWLAQSHDWNESARKYNPVHEYRNWSLINYNGLVNADLQASQGQSSDVTIAIGGIVSPAIMEVYRKATAYTDVETSVLCQFSFELNRIYLWFE
jgi:hypothetical protein